jgi:hypothetical protein
MFVCVFVCMCVSLYVRGLVYVRAFEVCTWMCLYMRVRVPVHCLCICVHCVLLCDWVYVCVCTSASNSARVHETHCKTHCYVVTPSYM